MSGAGKKVVDTAVKAAAKGIDWDGMAKLLVSDEARKEFATLRRAFDEVNSTLQTKFSQVIKKVEVRVKTIKDNWAMRFLNFIVCANQLLFEGLTCELPVFCRGVWMVGSIDEIRMPVKETLQNSILVDTKTRSEPTLPPEPQKRT